MPTALNTNLLIVDALNNIVSQNYYSAMQTMRIMYNFDPSQDIVWLSTFEA